MNVSTPIDSKKSWRSQLRQRLLFWLRPGQSDTELLQIVARAEAVQSNEHRKMITRLIEFDDLRVRDLMTPRSDICAIAVHCKLAEAAKTMCCVHHGCIPVFGEHLDDMLGVLYRRNVFKAIVNEVQPSLNDIIQPCIFFAELERAWEALRRMKREGVKLAIVRDEYGGTAGVLSLSDMLEEIVGNIEDETASSNEDIDEFNRLDDGSMLVSARLRAEEFEELADIDLPEGEYATIGGLLLAELGRIPQKGETISIGKLVFTITEATPRRLLKLKIVQAQALVAETDKQG
ncbi:MAG: transporter associated domain-containing protein [Mariprofundales bacterium]